MLQFILNTCSASGTVKMKGGEVFISLLPAVLCQPPITLGWSLLNMFQTQEYCSLVPVAVCDGNQSAVTP